MSDLMRRGSCGIFFSFLSSFYSLLSFFLFFSFQVICTRAGGGLMETAVLGEIGMDLWRKKTARVSVDGWFG
jgi:hypothetical protein